MRMKRALCFICFRFNASGLRLIVVSQTLYSFRPLSSLSEAQCSGHDRLKTIILSDTIQHAVRQDVQSQAADIVDGLGVKKNYKVCTFMYLTTDWLILDCGWS